LSWNQLCGVNQRDKWYYHTYTTEGITKLKWYHHTYTTEGITKLCEGLEGSAITSLECAAP